MRILVNDNAGHAFPISLPPVIAGWVSANSYTGVTRRPAKKRPGSERTALSVFTT
jgi:hypothetical protein